LNQYLAQPDVKWDLKNSQEMQLSTATGYGPRVLKALIPELLNIVTDPLERSLLDQLAKWDGNHAASGILPTVFNQLLYQLAEGTMADELGPVMFKNLLKTRTLDAALPRLAADANSPWWDNRSTPAFESRSDTLKGIWRTTQNHLQDTLGKTPSGWSWGKAHTLTHKHLLGQQRPLDLLYDVGPFEVSGGREVPNNLSYPIGPAPWAVNQGPSTRRLIDFALPTQSLGINPVGQSGVLFDRHYSDQAGSYAKGEYVAQRLSQDDIKANTRSVLRLKP
jgi:penicillin amidase